MRVDDEIAYWLRGFQERSCTEFPRILSHVSPYTCWPVNGAQVSAQVNVLGDTFARRSAELAEVTHEKFDTQFRPLYITLTPSFPRT